MTIKHLDHLNLTVSNLDETIAWYGAVFGFEVVERGERESGPWAVIRGGESTLCIYQDANRVAPDRFQQADRSRHVIYHFGFRITDREAWLEKVRAHDLVLDHGGENLYPHSSSWYVSDPTGCSIEVVLWNEDEIQFDAVA